MRASQAYLASWCGIALAASIGSLDKYADGAISTRVLSWIGIVTGGLMLLGVIVEVLGRHEKVPASVLACLFSHDAADRCTHIAVQLLTVSSIGIAAVNMDNTCWDWQFGMSCALMWMVFLYNLAYTPSVLASIATYDKLSQPVRLCLDQQFLATSYIWKKSQVEDRLLASAM